VTATLAALALAATLVCAAALVVVHLLPTGYRPLRDAVSDYGVGPYRAWYRVQASALGIAGLLVAAALWSGVTPVPAKSAVLLVVFGLARLAIPWYPTDLAGEERTRTGRIHVALAAAAFLTAAVAAPALHAAVKHEAGWADVSRALGVLGWTVAGASLATAIAVRSPSLRPRFGLIERLLYASILAWFLLVEAHLA